MASDDDRPLRGLDDLLAPFLEACKGSEVRLLGTESEKFGVHAVTGQPVLYEGGCGILGLFDGLLATGQWAPVREREGGPIIAVEQHGAHGLVQVSLEPGAQLELSGAPVPTVHAVADELAQHVSDIARVTEACGVRWLAAGYHPLATPDELPWVPKARYRIMRDYFPRVGRRGLDMMRRTATVQVNLDYADEEDAMRKMRVGLALAPVATAIFANSPFAEGRILGAKSERALVWTDVDSARCGLVPRLWSPTAGFRDYAEWALDVPMYLFKRGDEVVANTGQPFRAFMEQGFAGHHALMKDWRLHLNTVFPEVRLQRTIELRSADSQSRGRLPALAALWAGLLYDERALEAAEELAQGLDHVTLEAARGEIGRLGLGASVGDRPVRALAEAMMQLALEGLGRRARLDGQGRDESIHLASLAALTFRGLSPADELVEGLDPNDPQLRAKIIERTAM